MALKIKNDRKVKREKEREQELEKVGQRALGFMKSRGIEMGLGLNASPQAELIALEEYVEDLNHLREELKNKWGSIPEYSRSSWWLDREISNALERIVKLNIELTNVR